MWELDVFILLLLMFYCYNTIQNLNWQQHHSLILHEITSQKVKILPLDLSLLASEATKWPPLTGAKQEQSLCCTSCFILLGLLTCVNQTYRAACVHGLSMCLEGRGKGGRCAAFHTISAKIFLENIHHGEMSTYTNGEHKSCIPLLGLVLNEHFSQGLQLLTHM